MPKPERKTVFLQIRVTRDERARFKRAARRARVSLSRYVRAALAQRVAVEGEP